MSKPEVKKLSKTKPVKKNSGKKLKVYPQTFALDEKNNQGLVIFETVKSKVSFSIHMGSGIDINLFLSQTFKRKESGFKFSLELLKGLGNKIDKGVLLDLDKGQEAILYLQNKEDKKTSEISLSLMEILSLWSLENFDLYAEQSFIERCRDIRVATKDTSVKLKPELYKTYGQKYLM